MNSSSCYGIVLAVVFFGKSLAANDTSSNNTTNPTCASARPCKDGLIIPKWLPEGGISTGELVGRAAAYIIALVYIFIGVAIISDRFMASIEVIVSQTRMVKVKRKNGQVKFIKVKLWNETVSNLTLMALGSSAPEILLSVIEICGNSFDAGDLGPGTIVGSAAFNLFIITGICIMVVSNGEAKRIKFLRVFFVTAAWSVFAYVWLYLIIAAISPGKVEVWEGIVTLLCFPGIVITAWAVDRKFLLGQFLRRKVRAGDAIMSYTIDSESGPSRQLSPVEAEYGKSGGVFQTIVRHSAEIGHELATLPSGASTDDSKVLSRMTDDDIADLNQRQRALVGILRHIRHKYPKKSAMEMQEMAEVELLKELPKSRGFYRVQAVHRLSGSGGGIKREKIHERLARDSQIQVQDSTATEETVVENGIQRVFFDPDFYAVMESVGHFPLTVCRKGPNLENHVSVDYFTINGTAEAEKDYVAKNGTLQFRPGETSKELSIEVIDDDVFEEDERFFVRLANLRVGRDGADTRVELGTDLATVLILDDDHGGIFSFESSRLHTPEDVGAVAIKVFRNSGARGGVSLPYKTRPGTAISGAAYTEEEDGYLEFGDNETEKEIFIPLINESKYEKLQTFYVVLGEPIWHFDFSSADFLTDKEREIASRGRPALGDHTTVKVTIHESDDFRKTIDKIANAVNVSEQVSTSTWREQFVEAVTVSAGDDDDDDDATDGNADRQERKPSCKDYAMHVLTVFWKVLFACVPPTNIWHGWLCFFVSLTVIGFLTAIINDLASSLGCTIGIKDSLTAITFVAIGTSLPDTFASKVAAVKDHYADASIGNVTGSNAVNVFLGIGLAWTVAAIYHASKNQPFVVDPGSLAFSITLFCSCAVAAIVVLLLRRLPPVGGELGGPAAIRYPSAMFYFTLWISYITLSALEIYCVIPGF